MGVWSTKHPRRRNSNVNAVDGASTSMAMPEPNVTDEECAEVSEEKRVIAESADLDLNLFDDDDLDLADILITPNGDDLRSFELTAPKKKRRKVQRKQKDGESESNGETKKKNTNARKWSGKRRFYKGKYKGKRSRTKSKPKSNVNRSRQIKKKRRLNHNGTA